MKTLRTPSASTSVCTCFENRFVERHVVEFRGDGEAGGFFVAAVDDDDAVVVVGILHVERLAGFFGAEITTGGLQIIIEEVPDGGGPSVIEHPLNDTGGGVFVAGVGLEHGAFAFVGHSLRFQQVLVEALRRAIDRVHRAIEVAEILEAFGACVIVPERILRPHVIGGNEIFSGSWPADARDRDWFRC